MNAKYSYLLDFLYSMIIIIIERINVNVLPCVLKLFTDSDGLALDTLQVYSPPSLPVTVRVWVYFAVVALFKTVISFPMAVVEFLVQVTVVAGPPVETQVRVN